VTLKAEVERGSLGEVRSVYARRLIPRGRHGKYSRTHPASRRRSMTTTSRGGSSTQSRSRSRHMRSIEPTGASRTSSGARSSSRMSTLQ
jgi:hypothetical protein